MADNTAFETQDMSQALHQVSNGALAAPKEPAVAGWTNQQTEDYTSNEPIIVSEAPEGSKPLYPWDQPEMGDVGPKLTSVEEELFGPESERGGQGLDFAKISEISVTQEGEERVEPIKTFVESKLHPAIVENTALAGYTVPTPIQKFVIPAVLSGRDVIGIAQTGSGKTAAYLIPIMSMLMGKAKRWCAPRPRPTDEVVLGVNSVKAEPLVLVVVPTRELAVQIFNEARKFAYRSMFRPCVVYGGAPVKDQLEILGKGCDILIGTPGRLKDFVNRPHLLTLARLKYTIIDEADEMLGDDWTEELDPILRGGEQDEGNVKFCLFSATFPKTARDLAKEYLSEQHVRIRVGRAGSTTSAILQNIVPVDRNDRRKALMEILADMSGVRTMIFANSLQEVDNLDDFLYNNGLPVTSIHRDRSQREREAAIRAFRAGNAPIIVTTAVMARGIDVKNVRHVINYDLPTLEFGGIEEYTHRIGRTGRIGNRGLATSFFTERDEDMGSVLARTLLEADQAIPEFLQHHITEGMTKETVKFETESDFDEGDLGQPGDLGEDAGAGWGGGDDAAGGQDGDDTANNNFASADAWGSGADTGANNEPAQAAAW